MRKIHPKSSTTDWVRSKLTHISYYFLAILSLILIVSLIRNIQSLRVANQRIDKARSELKNLQNEQDSLNKQAKSVDSSYFTEKEARDKLGYAKDGEVVIVLPSQDILRRLAPVAPQEEYQSPPEPHWKQWLKLFF
jgi:cell division protein FtsB